MHSVGWRHIFVASTTTPTTTKRFIMSNISISALERMASTFAKKLVELGYTVDVDKFESGAGGRHGHTKPSYVELTIRRASDDAFLCVNLLANGYGSVTRSDISTDDGWVAARAEVMRRLGINTLKVCNAEEQTYIDKVKVRWLEIARQPLEFVQIGEFVRAYGSELACLRLFRVSHFSARVEQCENTGRWFFETQF